MGYFEAGKPHGSGIRIFGTVYEVGTIFVGEFERGHQTGDGKFTFPHQETYEGTFEDFQIKGTGLYKWPAGKQYVGAFQPGLSEEQCREAATSVSDY